MTSYIAITNSEVQPEAPITSELMTKLRDNPLAIAEGASGAPKIDPILAMAHGGAAGAVGTYAFAWLNSTSTPPAFGATVAGSNLRPAGFTSGEGVSSSANGTVFPSGSVIYGSDGTSRSALSGTWRCMGEARQASLVSGDYPHTLWLRIS